MGNVNACMNRNKSNSTSKLMNFSNSSIQKISLPTSVAELMIEFPGQVISCAEDLVLTWHIQAMQADEQLKPNKVYLMIHKNRAGFRINERQLLVVKMVMSGKTVLDLVGKVVPDTEIEEKNRLLDRTPVKITHWKPSLETIIECS